jgi:hypothetical protein
VLGLIICRACGVAYASNRLDPIDSPERRRSERLPCDRRFGRNDHLCGEPDVAAPDLETVIVDLLEGQYKSPIRIVAFNTAEKRLQDVSADVAYELRQRCDLQLRDVPFFLQDFMDQYEGRHHDHQLALSTRLI